MEPTVQTASCGACADDARVYKPSSRIWQMPAVMGLVVAALLVAVAGCTSMRSTMLTLTGDGWLVGQSNGSDKRFGMTRPYRGVPVKLQVPAYLHVTVGENVYLYDAQTELQEYQLSHPDRWVEQEIVNVDKVFTIDLARPLSGTSSFNLKIDQKTGYFSSISGTITDTSITDVGALVGTVASLAIPKSPGGGERDTRKDLRSRLVIERRVVAERFFDLADCDLDAQVAAFIDSHVNCGHSCRGHERPGQPKGVPPVRWDSPDCPAEVLLAPITVSGTQATGTNSAAAPRAMANRDEAPGKPLPEALPAPAPLTMPLTSGIAVGADRLRSVLPPATKPIDE